VLRFHVDDCTVRHIRIRVRPPVAVQIHVSPLTLGTDYGIPDSRLFGVRVGFSFTPSA
jgi:hypothetical protein